MNNSRLRKMLCGVGVAALLVSSGNVFAQDDPSDPSLDDLKARVLKSAEEFAQIGQGSPLKTMEAILSRNGYDFNTAHSIAVKKEYTGKKGRTFAEFEQYINGLRVYGAYSKLVLDQNDRPIHVVERFAEIRSSVRPAAVTEEQALQAALDRNFAGAPIPPRTSVEENRVMFDAGTFFFTEPIVEKVVIQRGKGERRRLIEGFLVQTWGNDDNQLYMTLVNGKGRVLRSKSRTTSFDSYRVYTNSPTTTPQRIIQGPGSGNGQSPSGWLSGTQGTTRIQGNNVQAYLDRDGNNRPDASGAPVNDGNFTATSDLSQDPGAGENRAVAVQNLFYLNNIVHDRLYRHGFVEGVGNFQENNFGRGGRGSDSVNAEAQDGAGLDNANFATPPDGSNPRMQMFLWNGSPLRDGSLDSDIVYHEYGHGLTFRMIGDMGGDSVASAVGEGMADVVAFLINGDDAIAEYSNGNTRGIRSARYGVNTRRLSDFQSGERRQHGNGEIYASTIWSLRTAYLSNGLTNDELFDDLVSAMNFTPSRPDFFDMRDGILAAVSGARTCMVWRAFAERGMGEGGSMTVTGFFRNTVSVTESTRIPASCEGGNAGVSNVELANAVPRSNLQANNRSRWRARVRVTTSGSERAGATVAGTWSTGASGSCVTRNNGRCSINLSGFSVANVASVSFTIESINGDTNAPGVPQTVVVNRP